MSDKRYIVIPKPLLGGFLPFGKTLEHVVDHYSHFARPASRVRAGQRILEAYDAGKESGVMEIGAEDWTLLSEAIESAEAGFCEALYRVQPDGSVQCDAEGKPLRVDPPARAFLPHVNAIANATITRPEAPQAKPSAEAPAN